MAGSLGPMGGKNCLPLSCNYIVFSPEKRTRREGSLVPAIAPKYIKVIDRSSVILSLFMKIKSTDSIGSSSGVKKPTRARGSGGASFASHLSEPEEAQSVSSTNPLSNIDSLLSLQGIGTSIDGRRRARQYGEDVLKSLEVLLHDLLMGEIPLTHLQELADLMQQQREFGDLDPKMQEIVEEIETRALVELAKYETRL